MVKTVSKYELYRTLGEGSFGKVKYAVNKETNEAVAVKILDKDKIQKQNMGAQIKKEISIMRMIKHDNVVCVKDVFATTSNIFIVLELVEGGELFDKITSQGRLGEPQARFYFRQVVEGLDHCHSQGVCHRDLKPEVFTSLRNFSALMILDHFYHLTLYQSYICIILLFLLLVFFSSSSQNLLLDAQGNIKISDFGLSALHVGDADSEGQSRAELLHTTCGTPNYVAPEVC
jgi:serine/threonine protein kinase